MGWFSPLAQLASVGAEPDTAEAEPDTAEEEPDSTETPEQDQADTEPAPADESREAAPAMQRRWADFGRSLDDRCVTASDCEAWEKATDAFMRRWNATTTAGQQSLLHGAVQGRGRNATRIGVQPTATARRRSTLLRGRGRVSAGRPAKAARTAEHGYNAVDGRRRAAPHSLSECTASNRALGR